MASRNQVNVALSGSTGSGTFVGTTSPTMTSPSLTTPILGTAASGNLINCSGTPWGSQGGSPLPMQFASGSLSTAMINNLSASPVQIVAAGAANTLIMVQSFIGHYVYNSTPFTAAAAQVIRLRLGTTQSLIASVVTNAFLVGTNSTTNTGSVLAVSNTTDASSLGVGLFLVNPVATEITGGDSKLNWYVWYQIITTV